MKRIYNTLFIVGFIRHLCPPVTIGWMCGHRTKDKKKNICLKQEMVTVLL